MFRLPLQFINNANRCLSVNPFSRRLAHTALYQKIGGEPAVNLVVDRFYDIVLSDSRINHLFKNTNMQRQRRMQKSFLNHVLGGKEYNGKGMRAAHAKLNLTDAHFDAVADNLGKAMKDLSVPDDLIKQVLAVAETTRDDVLGR